MAEQSESKVSVRVFARPDRGRYRAGQHWPHQWVFATVARDELGALESDPELVVQRDATRHPDDALASKVQPGAEPKKERKPWGDMHLQKLQREALEREAEAKAAQERESQERAASSQAESEDDDDTRPGPESQRPEHSQQRKHGKKRR